MRLSLAVALAVASAVSGIDGTHKRSLDQRLVSSATTRNASLSSRSLLGGKSKALTNSRRRSLSAWSTHRSRRCIPHAGLVTQSWFAPYRKRKLPARLRNIKYKDRKVDCNPASCDNPPQCGIPPCKTIGHYSSAAYTKAVYVNQKCDPARGCGLSTTVVTQQEPSKDNAWTGLWITQPATRVGASFHPTYSPGFLGCYPSPSLRQTGKGSWTSLGSWLTAGRANCNPDDLKVCNKLSIAHSTMPRAAENMHRRAVAVFFKTTWCVRGVCYSAKRGRCYRLKKSNIMPEYASSATKSHSKKAYEELKAGRYDNKCSVDAKMAVRDVIIGN